MVLGNGLGALNRPITCATLQQGAHFLEVLTGVVATCSISPMEELLEREGFFCPWSLPAKDSQVEVTTGTAKEVWWWGMVLPIMWAMVGRGVKAISSLA